VTGDKLVRDVIEVVADDLRLRANRQNVIAYPLDQRGFPASGHSAECVPGVAGDHAQLRGLNAKLLFNLSVRLRGWFMTLYDVHAKEPFKKWAIPACSI
jgi:hypothetical protein